MSGLRAEAALSRTEENARSMTLMYGDTLPLIHCVPPCTCVGSFQRNPLFYPVTSVTVLEEKPSMQPYFKAFQLTGLSL